MPAIETTGLTKSFAGQRRIPGVREGRSPVIAVQDLDLAVETGEVFGFLGPNGAGKSTTINMLLDYVRPTAGSAMVLGRDAQTASTSIHDDLGVLPERLSLWQRLTAREHVRLAADAKDVVVEPDRLLERVGVDDAADRAVGTFSTGMRQRLGLAMALVGDPELLLLDEPTTGLDPNGVQRLRDIVATEADRGTTVFFSSHVLQEVGTVCDRVAILREGTLVAVDTVEGLRANSGAGIELRTRMDEPPDDIETTVAAVDGVVDVDRDGHEVRTTCRDDSVKVEVLNAVQEAGATVEDFQVETPGLEALFAAYTSRDGDRPDGTEATDGATADEDGEAVR
jgi:ABC-2 type transport system ATP-binding protein